MRYLNAQVEGLAPKLAKVKFDVVVISPFTRCLQTAYRLLSNWEVENQRVVIDKAFSEIHSPTLLYQTARPDCFGAGILRRWRWRKRFKERVDKILGGLKNISIEYGSRSWPSFPESRSKGRARFASGLDYWATRQTGNMLFITHGDVSLETSPCKSEGGRIIINHV